MEAESGASNRGDAELSQLLVPLELARPELEKLVAEGKALQAVANSFWQSQFDSAQVKSWERLTGDAERWSRHTWRLLQTWFSEKEVAREFTSPRGRELSYAGRYYTPPSQCKLAEDLCDQVAVLETLIRRLESHAMPVPGLITDIPLGSAGDAQTPPAPSYITYNIRGSVGQLIAGEGQRVSNINSHIAAVMGQGEPQVGAALQRLAEVTLSDPELDQQTRAEVLETIEDLAEAAEAEPAERKTGRIKGAIAVIGSAAGAATQLGEAWRQWGPVITQHLRLP